MAEEEQSDVVHSQAYLDRHVERLLAATNRQRLTLEEYRAKNKDELQTINADEVEEARKWREKLDKEREMKLKGHASNKKHKKKDKKKTKKKKKKKRKRRRSSSSSSDDDSDDEPTTATDGKVTTQSSKSEGSSSKKRHKEKKHKKRKKNNDTSAKTGPMKLSDFYGRAASDSSD